MEDRLQRVPAGDHTLSCAAPRMEDRLQEPRKSKASKLQPRAPKLSSPSHPQPWFGPRRHPAGPLFTFRVFTPNIGLFEKSSDRGHRCDPLIFQIISYSWALEPNFDFDPRFGGRE